MVKLFSSEQVNLFVLGWSMFNSSDPVAVKILKRFNNDNLVKLHLISQAGEMRCCTLCTLDINSSEPENLGIWIKEYVV